LDDMMDRTTTRRENRRPALWAAIFVVGGILLGQAGGPPPGWIALAACLLLILSLLAAGRRLPRPWPCLFLGLALLCAACLNYRIRIGLFPRHHLRNHLAGRTMTPKETVVRGRILSEPKITDGDASFVLQAAAVDTGSGPLPAAGRIQLRIRDFRGRSGPGDRVSIRGRLRRPREARNPGEFDYRDYLRRRDIWALLTADAGDVETGYRGSRSWLSALAERARQALNTTIVRTLPGSPRALLRGLLLGQRDEVPEEVTAAFSNAGVIHVLAVSGLHVGLIIGIFYALFSGLRCPRTAATLLTLVLAAFYMVVVDLRPSVVRATIMAAAVMGGRLMERDADLLNTIPFAGLIILIWNPRLLFELGFQLSFAATLSIVYLQGRLQSLCFPFLSAASSRWLRWIAAGLTVSLAAQLGTLPIVAYHFQKIPVISLAANLVVVPLVGIAVALGFTAALIFPLSAGLAGLYAAANWLVLSLLIELVGRAAALPMACFHVPQPSPRWILIYYLFLFLGANVKRSRNTARIFLAGGLILLNVLVWKGVHPGGDRLRVIFFDVGQGDAALVSFPNGRRMLVDGGERTLHHDCGERILCPYFRRNGIRRLDVVVMTHADNDHVGGLPSVLQTVPVDVVLDPGAGHHSAIYRRFVSLARRPSVRYRRVRAGDRLLIDEEVAVMVLHPTGRFVLPDGQAPGGLNNSSIVLRLDYGHVGLLLTGDIEAQAEEALAAARRLQPAACLKVPHHGSISSSTAPFLKAVRPRLAVFSVGLDNRFGHPHRKVLERYRQMDIPVFRTDLDGAVLLETDGRRIKLSTTVEPRRVRFRILEGRSADADSAAGPGKTPAALFP
jgi:competence protein ComEC